MTRERTPLTPALLGQFGKYGVTTASGQALPEAPAQLSTHELKERGWTASMIAKLLPTHDATRANQLEVGWSQKPLTDPVKLYNLARVEAAEATEQYRTLLAQAGKAKQAAGKGQATRAEKVRAYVEGYVPQLGDPPAPLTGFDLWTYHRQELHDYERDNDDALRQLSPVDQRHASSQLYTLHRTAFLEKFGRDY